MGNFELWEHHTNFSPSQHIFIFFWEVVTWQPGFRAPTLLVLLEDYNKKKVMASLLYHLSKLDVFPIYSLKRQLANIEDI